MQKYRICFVGLGSIARRHIKNTAIVLESRNIGYEIDVLRSGNGNPIDPETESRISTVYYDINDINGEYDAVFITNPTQKHAETLKAFSGKAKAFFIEKPVFHTSEIDISELGIEEGVIYYVACPLRYNQVIRYVKANIDPKDVLGIRAISSSYLPDWRPGTDYRKTYSAIKELGGGVSIDLIHEWDYITYLIGMPNKVHSFIKKVSDLEINSDDIAVYIAEYDDKIVELHLDYFTKKAVRELRIMLNGETVTADIINGTVTYEVSGNKVDLNEDRDAYQIKEIEYFFDLIEKETLNENDLFNAYSVLRIAEGK